MRIDVDSKEFKMLKQTLNLKMWEAVGVIQSIEVLVRRYEKMCPLEMMSDVDIALRIEWAGSSQQLINALLESKYLVRTENGRLSMPKASADEAYAMVIEAKAEAMMFPTGVSTACREWLSVYPEHRRNGSSACSRIFNTVIAEISAEYEIGREQAIETLMRTTRQFSESEFGQSEFCWSAKTFLTDGHWRDSAKSWERKQKQLNGKHDAEQPIEATGW